MIAALKYGNDEEIHSNVLDTLLLMPLMSLTTADVCLFATRINMTKANILLHRT